MHQVNLQELAIAIAARNFTPGILTLDFLGLSGIIPSDWTPARQPVLNSTLAQLQFQNGVTLTAQPGSVTLAEPMANREGLQSFLPEMAQRLMDKLSNADYQGLAISARSLATFPTSDDAARQFLLETMIAPGPWRDFGDVPARASLTFFYQLSRRQLTLALNEAVVQQVDQAPLSAVWFNGTFNYDATRLPPDQRLPLLHQRLTAWQDDVQTTLDLIDQRFLRVQTSVFPQ